MILQTPELTLGELAMPAAETGDLITRRSSEGALLGYAKYRAYADCWALNDIFVVAYDRNRGHGSSMLRELLARATEANMPVVLKVASNHMHGSLDDDQLHAWYAAHGFQDHPEWGVYGPVMFFTPPDKELE